MMIKSLEELVLLCLDDRISPSQQANKIDFELQGDYKPALLWSFSAPSPGKCDDTLPSFEGLNFIVGLNILIRNTNMAIILALSSKKQLKKYLMKIYLDVIE